MRLTLRTLLAWLDDTLPAAEVRQIGKQVAESSFAQELVDRTYRVTRQRRLLVPASTGPEATDPNLVAAYLDSELSAEEVAEYEKKCLTSDVNLAEVASVHQILSLIGQKAKVPPEARHRMYRLIKGRESANTHASRAFPATPAAPVTPPIRPWSGPSAPVRPMAERVGIAALVVGLIGVVAWTAVSTLAPEVMPTRTNRAPEPAPEVASAEPAASGVAVPPKPDPEADARNRAAEAKNAAALDAAKADAANRSAPIKLAKGDSLAFGWNSDKGDWSRLNEASTIKDETRLLNLAPLWSTLQADTARVVLIGDSEVTVAGGDRGAAVKIGFGRGRAVVKGGPDGLPYLIRSGGRSLSVTNAPGTSVGLEKVWKIGPGVVESGAPPLSVFVPEGEVGLAIGEKKETIKGPGAATMDDSGAIKLVAKPTIPPWVAEAGPMPSEKELGGRFLKLFSPSGSVVRDLVQAVDGDDQDVRRLAIQGLGSVGNAEMIVPVLNNAMTDPATRRAAADVLRGMLARGGDAAKAVRSELVKVFGQDLAADSEKLLVGFTPEDGRREATYSELVRLLSTPDLGTRELALQSLMSLTGRDSLEFDPTRPEGKGLKAWQDLLHRKELTRPAPSAVAPR